LADRPFAQAEAARLEEARLAAGEALADALLAAGRPAEAVAPLEAVVVAAPYREDAWGRLMLARYRAGRQGDALRAYQDLRRILADDLGLEPKPDLRDLETRILAQSPDLDGPRSRGPVTVPPAVGMRAFLFTDIEASTRRWERATAAMATDLARHDELLRTALAANCGRVMSHTGDGMCAEFPSASSSLQAALDAQRAFRAEPWQGGELRVRMALHVGAAQERDGTWFGPTLNRTARLLALGAGGQVLCSQAATDLAWDALPAGVTLSDLGEHRLADLARPERVFQLAHADLPADFPPPRSSTVNPHNLPSAPDRFLGRAAELAELEELLDRERMITLWGPGGAGKTRLSLELAGRVLPDFPDGAWFVGLAPVRTDDGVPPAVISALDMLADATAPLEDELGRYLAPRRALLVLDNCEHVVGAAARLSRTLLERCPGVRVVASSRELLGVPGELAWPVPSLSLPENPDDPASLAASDAVGLFIERARTAQPAFALTGANASAVAEICRKLEGIPLALELAAARVRVLGVRGLAQRLDARLGVLTSGPRTADPRHQTLRSAVDWSYDLLPGAERELLGCLSVFAGSFDLAAAEAVAGASAGRTVGFEVLDLLARLVDKSLVVADETPDGDVRYRLLETIRQYAAEKLDAAGASLVIRRRHLAHYVDQAVRRNAQWRWRDADLQAIHAEHENYLSALEWALAERDAEAALGLTSNLYQYWIWSETIGVQGWLERSLQLAGGTRNLHVSSVMLALAYCSGFPELGRAAIAMAEEVAPPAMLAKYLLLAGHSDVGNTSAEARALLERGIRLNAEFESDQWTAIGHNALAWFEMADGRYAQAEVCAQRATSVNAADDSSSSLTVQHLSTYALAIALAGDADRALACSARAIERARGLPLPGVLIVALARATAVAVMTSRSDRGTEVLHELLGLLRRVGTRRWIGETLEFTAMLLEQTGRPGPAVSVLRDARTHRAERGEPHGGTLPAIADALTACVRRLGEPVHPCDAGSVDPRPLDAILLDALHALEN
jgi:predicted ATPase/class 3 adenylate cyclase